MGIEESVILVIAGAIAAILQHAQTLLQAIGWSIPPAIKRITAGALAFIAAAAVILVGEQNGAALSSGNWEDWAVAFMLALGGSQAIFALVLPRIGVPEKEPNTSTTSGMSA